MDKALATVIGMSLARALFGADVDGRALGRGEGRGTVEEPDEAALFRDWVGVHERLGRPLARVLGSGDGAQGAGAVKGPACECVFVVERKGIISTIAPPKNI